ncbi:titin isoform X2 [Nematostella vectensis]|uniref:titin isoform X2 n=1 Tax=Nematostella vectensis TaxID=45351 RepID=UPI0020773FBC|nr:titin isoform X2 [Nematostella vectensis]
MNVRERAKNYEAFMSSSSSTGQGQVLERGSSREGLFESQGVKPKESTDRKASLEKPKPVPLPRSKPKREVPRRPEPPASIRANSAQENISPEQGKRGSGSPKESESLTGKHSPPPRPVPSKRHVLSSVAVTPKPYETPKASSLKRTRSKDEGISRKSSLDSDGCRSPPTSPKTACLTRGPSEDNRSSPPRRPPPAAPHRTSSLSRKIKPPVPPKPKVMPDRAASLSRQSASLSRVSSLERSYAVVSPSFKEASSHKEISVENGDCTSVDTSMHAEETFTKKSGDMFAATDKYVYRTDENNELYDNELPDSKMGNEEHVDAPTVYETRQEESIAAQAVVDESPVANGTHESALTVSQDDVKKGVLPSLDSDDVKDHKSENRLTSLENKDLSESEKVCLKWELSSLSEEIDVTHLSGATVNDDGLDGDGLVEHNELLPLSVDHVDESLDTEEQNPESAPDHYVDMSTQLAKGDEDDDSEITDSGLEILPAIVESEPEDVIETHATSSMNQRYENVIIQNDFKEESEKKVQDLAADDDEIVAEAPHAKESAPPVLAQDDDEVLNEDGFVDARDDPTETTCNSPPRPVSPSPVNFSCIVEDTSEIESHNSEMIIKESLPDECAETKAPSASAVVRESDYENMNLYAEDSDQPSSMDILNEEMSDHKNMSDLGAYEEVVVKREEIEKDMNAKDKPISPTPVAPIRSKRGQKQRVREYENVEVKLRDEKPLEPSHESTRYENVVITTRTGDGQEQKGLPPPRPLPPSPVARRHTHGDESPTSSLVPEVMTKDDHPAVHEVSTHHPEPIEAVTDAKETQQTSSGAEESVEEVVTECSSFPTASPAPSQQAPSFNASHAKGVDISLNAEEQNYVVPGELKAERQCHDQSLNSEEQTTSTTGNEEDLYVVPRTLHTEDKQQKKHVPPPRPPPVNKERAESVASCSEDQVYSVPSLTPRPRSSSDTYEPVEPKAYSPKPHQPPPRPAPFKRSYTVSASPSTDTSTDEVYSVPSSLPAGDIESLDRTRSSSESKKEKPAPAHVHMSPNPPDYEEVCPRSLPETTYQTPTSPKPRKAPPRPAPCTKKLTIEPSHSGSDELEDIYRVPSPIPKLISENTSLQDVAVAESFDDIVPKTGSCNASAGESTVVIDEQVYVVPNAIRTETDPKSTPDDESSGQRETKYEETCLDDVSRSQSPSMQSLVTDEDLKLLQGASAVSNLTSDGVQKVDEVPSSSVEENIYVSPRSSPVSEQGSKYIDFCHKTNGDDSGKKKCVTSEENLNAVPRSKSPSTVESEEPTQSTSLPFSDNVLPEGEETYSVPLSPALSLENEHISALDDEELPAPKRSSVVLTSRPGSRKDSAPPKPPRSRGTSVSIDEKLEAENPLSENKLREEKPATPEAPPRRLTVNKEDEEKTKSTEAVSPKPKRPAPPRPTVPSQGRSEGDKIQAEGDKDAVKPSRPAPPAPRRPPPPAVKQDGEKEVLPVLLKGDSTDSESDDEDLPVSAPKPTGPPKKKTYHITHEILSTERTFVESLRLAYEDCYGSVKAAEVVPESTLNEIFKDLGNIYHLDVKFLQELEERMKTWEDHERIGDIVKKYGHFLKMYTTYINNYDKAANVLQETMKENPQFAELVLEFQASKKCKGLMLNSFMLKPVQRIPSYRLLLIDYLKHLPPESAEYQDIKVALDIVSEVATHINESMKRVDNFEQVLRIQGSLVGHEEIVRPGREFIKQGNLLKLCRKDMQERTFFLLTDVLLYTAPVGGNQYKLRETLPLLGMKVILPESQEFVNEFSIISTTRSFTLSASTSAERDEWLEELERAINAMTKKKISFFKSKEGITVTQQDSEDTKLGEKAPVWIPDARVTMCMLCTDDFTVTNRRHHCRGCGKVVCGSCSDNLAPLTYLDYAQARVCDMCYEVLLREQNKEARSEIKEVEPRPQLPGDSESLDRIHRKPARFEILHRFKPGSKKNQNRKSKMYRPSVCTEVVGNESGSQVSGYLRCKRPGKHGWKRLWFVLKDNVLYTYKASEDVVAQETIPVLGYEVEEMRKSGDDIEFQLRHAGLQPIHFKAENEASALRWTEGLKKASTI